MGSHAETVSPSGESMFKVFVHFDHSEIHGRLFLPLNFGEDVTKRLEMYKVSADPIPIQQDFSGAESIGLLPRLVLEHINLPPGLFSALTSDAISIKEEYRPRTGQRATVETSGTIQDFMSTLEHETYLAEIDGVFKFLKQPNAPRETSLCMATTAGRLSYIINICEISGRFQSSTDGLVETMTAFRHYVSALHYLEEALKTTTDEQTRVSIAHQEARVRIDRLLAVTELADMLNDWYRLGLNTSDRVDPHTVANAELERRFKNYVDNRSTVLEEKIAEFRSRTGTAEAPAPDPVAYPVNPQGYERTDPEDYVSWNFPEVDASYASHSFRLPTGKLDAKTASFEIRSGQLLWGQLHTVFAGSPRTELEENASATRSRLPGGTILQRVLKYRSAARKGTWNVRRFLGQAFPYNDLNANRFNGWIMYHKDCDPQALIDRCARLTPSMNSISNDNDHIDKDILYVNRYDWAFNCSPGATDSTYGDRYSAFLDRTTGRQLPAEIEDDNEYQARAGFDLTTRNSNMLLALDAEEFDAGFMKTFRNDCHPRMAEDSEERTFAHKDHTYGAYVSYKHTEYELVFSGKKHPDFTQADEMVAIIYDATYCALTGHNWEVEDEVSS